jgi:hypothetical protein
MLLSFTFGKPKLVQALLISLALVGGGSAMAIMPRMGKGIRSDEGVQGRMLAWEQARLAMQTNRYGVGYEKFHAFIRWKEGRYLRVIPKATHGSYINIGADLGYPGMFFYMLVIAASLRTAMLPIPIAGRDRLRRARDALFLFLAMSVVSGWMIDRAYALEFFLLAACFSAFHRILLRENEELRAVEKGEGEVPNPDAEQSEVELRSAVPAVTYGPDLKPTLVLPSAAKAQIVRPLWRRLGVIEFVLAGGFTYATVAVWDRILSSFLW